MTHNEQLLVDEIVARKKQIDMFQDQINIFTNGINISQTIINDCERKLRRLKLEKLKK